VRSVLLLADSNSVCLWLRIRVHVFMRCSSSFDFFSVFDLDDFGERKFFVFVN